MNIIRVHNDELRLKVPKRLHKNIEAEFPKFNLSTHEEYFEYSFLQYPNVSFVLKYLLIAAKGSITASDDAMRIINAKSSIANKPTLSLYITKSHVEINCPPLNHYLRIVELVGAADKGMGMYTVPIARAFEVIRTVETAKSFLPPFEVDKSIATALIKPIEGFDGSVASLFSTPIDDLYATVKAYRLNEEKFNNAGYFTVSDFLLQKPRNYIDKTQVSDFSDLEFREPVTFIGTIVKKELKQYKHPLYHLQVGGTVFKIMYYNRGFLYDKYSVGDEVLIMGEYRGGKSITGSSIDSLLEAKSLDIIPIYPQSQKNNVQTYNVMNNVYEIIERLTPYAGELAEYIDTDQLRGIVFSDDEENMSLGKAIKELHFPSSSNMFIEALETLAFYELFYLQLVIQDRKATEVKELGLSKPQVIGGYMDKMRENFPWALTKAQEEGVKQFEAYLGSDTAEQVLLSADVGAGKSVLAQLACMQSLDNGYQSVLAGPTEVLARQLYDGFTESIAAMPEDYRPTIAYLGGGVKAAEKRDILKHVKSGDIDILVGTHSVLNAKIEYKNLGLVVVDEQQKFGKAQREALLDTRLDNKKPDLITQTATPIPRSTAQAFYGDIDIIQLEGKPPGRKEVVTEWIKDNPKNITKDTKHPMWADIQQEIDKGHQVFIVVPMVHDSKLMQAASVEGAYKDLQKIFGSNVSYMHGQMKKADQNEAMERFRNNEDKILIGSTVIEVGVNIPNATRMIVLSADRMGASSLHQIRGRVGRSELESKCYLVSEGKTKASQIRLQALVDTTNGFEIATIDLKTRGEGDLFGIRQAGESSLMFATLVDHSKLINKAQAMASEVYNSEYKEIALRDAIAVIKKRDSEED